MGSREEFSVNRLGRVFHKALGNIHEPAYLGYDIGTPFVMGFRSGREVLAYYAGFTGDDTIKFGCSRIPHHIFATPESSYPILYTRKLQVIKTFKCKCEEELLRIFGDLAHLTMIELEYDESDDKIRRIGFFKKTGDQSPTLAHSHSLRGKRVDTWYRPAFVPSKDWPDPNGILSLEGVQKIRVLEEI